MKTPAAKWIFWMALLLFPLCGGCGYHSANSGGNGPRLPVFITVLENRTAETGLENRITNELVRELTADSRFLVSAPDEGGGILSGAVLSILEDSASRRVSGLSSERRLRVAVSLSLLGPEGRTVWKNNSLQDFETYVVVQEQPGLTSENRSRALIRLSTRLARKARFEMGSVWEAFGGDVRED